MKQNKETTSLFKAKYGKPSCTLTKAGVLVNAWSIIQGTSIVLDKVISKVFEVGKKRLYDRKLPKKQVFGRVIESTLKGMWVFDVEDGKNPLPPPPKE